MATKDIKPSTETGLTRRQVLGKALKTGAGAVASDILDPALLGGLTDLITGKGGIVKVPASTLNQKEYLK